MFPRKIGAVRFDWVTNSNGTFNGTSQMDEYGVDVWIVPGQVNGPNYWAQTSGSSLPVRFWEYIMHKDPHPYKAWDFNLWSYKPKAPEASLFVPPSNCTQTCTFLGKEE